MYRLYAFWGASPDPTDDPVVYEFNTDKERLAFLDGAEAAVGWHDMILADTEAEARAQLARALE